MKTNKILKPLVVALLLVAVASGCLGMRKRPFAPDNEDLRYMYITVYPDEATIILTVEFADGTATFRDTRITKIHEPISYSIDRRKVKKITLTVKKIGWVTQTKEWNDEVPFDVFVKLNTVE